MYTWEMSSKSRPLSHYTGWGRDSVWSLLKCLGTKLFVLIVYSEGVLKWPFIIDTGEYSTCSLMRSSARQRSLSWWSYTLAWTEFFSLVQLCLGDGLEMAEHSPMILEGGTQHDCWYSLLELSLLKSTKLYSA